MDDFVAGMDQTKCSVNNQISLALGVRPSQSGHKHTAIDSRARLHHRVSVGWLDLMDVVLHTVEGKTKNGNIQET